MHLIVLGNQMQLRMYQTKLQPQHVRPWQEASEATGNFMGIYI